MKKIIDHSKLFRKLMLKGAELKKQQKANGSYKRQAESARQATKEQQITEPSQNEEESKPVPTQESEPEAAADFCDGKLSKKQKLNQKKKR